MAENEFILTVGCSQPPGCSKPVMDVVHYIMVQYVLVSNNVGKDFCLTGNGNILELWGFAPFVGILVFSVCFQEIQLGFFGCHPLV